VQQELIAEFHQTSIWLVVVTVDDNISKPNRTDFIDRDGSYVYFILIPEGNFENFQGELFVLTKDQEGNFTRLWNSEVRFVWLEQSLSQCCNKREHLIISLNLEYITVLS